MPMYNQTFYYIILFKVYILEERSTGKKFASKTFFKQKLNKQTTGKQSLELELKILRLLPTHPSLIHLHETYSS